LFNPGSPLRRNGRHIRTALAVKGDGVVDRGGINGLGVAFAFRTGSGIRVRFRAGFGPGIRAGALVVYGGVAGRDKEAQEYEKYKKKTT
jgi:hypothetical protein